MHALYLYLKVAIPFAVSRACVFRLTVPFAVSRACIFRQLGGPSEVPPDGA